MASASNERIRRLLRPSLPTPLTRSMPPLWLSQHRCNSLRRHKTSNHSTRIHIPKQHHTPILTTHSYLRRSPRNIINSKTCLSSNKPIITHKILLDNRKALSNQCRTCKSPTHSLSSRYSLIGLEAMDLLLHLSPRRTHSSSPSRLHLCPRYPSNTAPFSHHNRSISPCLRLQVQEIPSLNLPKVKSSHLPMLPTRTRSASSLANSRPHNSKGPIPT